MKIEYWSDFSCPFCYIGRTRLARVLKALSLEDKVQVVMRSFQLDPQAPEEPDCTTTVRFARKYGLSLGEAHERIRKITLAGREEGITDMNYAGTVWTNTLDAHRLSKYACSLGMPEVTEMLYHACFCEHRNLSSRQVLLDIAERAGIDKAGAVQMLDSDRFLKEVRDDEMEAEFKSIYMIPHFLIDGRRSLSGVVSAEEFLRFLQG